MLGVVAVPRAGRLEKEQSVELLLADEDAVVRSHVVSRVRDRIGSVAVLEAGDGVEAIRIGLEWRPQIALLDVNTPRLGGIEVALTLRKLQPWMRFAVYAADPMAHRHRARSHSLPLFAKDGLADAFAWLELQTTRRTRVPAGWPESLTLECASCGYGVARPSAPERCPMCGCEGAWAPRLWRRAG